MEYIPTYTKVDTEDYNNDMARLEKTENLLNIFVERVDSIVTAEDWTMEEKMEELKRELEWINSER